MRVLDFSAHEATPCLAAPAEPTLNVQTAESVGGFVNGKGRRDIDGVQNEKMQ